MGRRWESNLPTVTPNWQRSLCEGCSIQSQRTRRPQLSRLSSPEPHKAIEDELVLNLVAKSRRQFAIGLVLVIDVVVAHVEVEHPVFLVGPGYRVVTTVPDFMRLGPSPEREAARVNGEQNFDVWIRSQVILPAIPFTRRRLERHRQM